MVAEGEESGDYLSDTYPVGAGGRAGLAEAIQKTETTNSGSSSTATTQSSTNNNNNVNVAVRCRPMSADEVKAHHSSVVRLDSLTKTVTLVTPIQQLAPSSSLRSGPATGHVEDSHSMLTGSLASLRTGSPPSSVSGSASSLEPAKVFTYDEVFGPESNQVTVYNSVARPIVDNVLQGYNGTIFAYGQTGTGKTHTMTGGGPYSRDDLSAGFSSSNVGGIIPNSFAQVFDHIAKCTKQKTFLVRVSYMELYNEEVRDLLQKQAPNTSALEVKERFDIGVYVKDLLSVTVSNADQCLRLMEYGNANRHVGQTAMNEQSSRSHAIFTLTIECSELVSSSSPSKSSLQTCAIESQQNQQQNEQPRHLFTQGKLHLVDLAGSERQSKTSSTGVRLKEASKINLSLSTLGNVISALVDSRSSHIPYRNSKLTRLLQDSLGGNSKTLMIATIGPASYNYDETLSTLRYANRAKSIQNVARINEDPKDALLRKFQTEIDALRRQLSQVNGTSAESDDRPQPSTSLDGINSNDLPDSPTPLVDKGTPHQQNKNRRIEEIEMEIEHDKRALAEEHGLKEAERRRLADNLALKENELRITKLERERLIKKLSAIERKLIVGGENMLEKAKTQAQLLEESNRELEKARQQQAQIQRQLQERNAEQADIEGRYSSLQEEVQYLTKRLKKVWSQNVQLRAELNDSQAEHQREMEALLENVRQIQRELSFASALLGQFVPDQQMLNIERNCYWNEEMGEWQLRCIAYTGNNLLAGDAPRPGICRIGGSLHRRRQQRCPSRSQELWLLDGSTFELPSEQILAAAADAGDGRRRRQREEWDGEQPPPQRPVHRSYADGNHHHLPPVVADFSGCSDSTHIAGRDGGASIAAEHSDVDSRSRRSRRGMDAQRPSPFAASSHHSATFGPSQSRFTQRNQQLLFRPHSALRDRSEARMRDILD